MEPPVLCVTVTSTLALVTVLSVRHRVHLVLASCAVDGWACPSGGEPCSAEGLPSQSHVDPTAHLAPSTHTHVPALLPVSHIPPHVSAWQLGDGHTLVWPVLWAEGHPIVSVCISRVVLAAPQVAWQSLCGSPRTPGVLTVCGLHNLQVMSSSSAPRF